MSGWRRIGRWVGGLICALSLAGATDRAWASDGQPQRLADENGVVPIAAFGNTVAWSHRDRKSGRYKLVVHEHERTRTLPATPRSGPFDVDLGTDSAGRLTAVYSRCRKQDNRAYGVDYTRGTGCHVYALPVHGGAERRLRLLGPSTLDALPTISRGRVAYVRRVTAASVPAIYLSTPRRPGHVTRQPGGTKLSDDDPGPSSLNLVGPHLTYLYSAFKLDVPVCPGQDASRVAPEVTQAELQTLAGGAQLLAETCDARPFDVNAITSDGSYAYLLTYGTARVMLSRPRNRR